MEIVIDIDNIPNILNLDKNIIFFGKNSNYKNKVINNIDDCLLGKSKNILIKTKKKDIYYRLNKEYIEELEKNKRNWKWKMN